ncbi:MAG: amino acid permease [Saprospiraceae bacterium]|nr:amino acid permease [Saprospiraceae bacterium]
MAESRKIGWRSAAAIVIANMVGTGVFSSLGFQLQSLHNTWTILSLWVIGALFSLLGAFSYAELGTRLPKSGGEYHFLSQIYHPFLGYLSGWVSMTVGFAASIALSAMAMGAYLQDIMDWPGQMIAIGAILVISIVHSFSVQQSSFFQNVLTLVKIFLILFLIFFGVTLYTPNNAINFSSSWQGEIFSPAYAVSLIYVTYAFSGWNAAAYIVEEIDSPKKNLPRALIGGTLLVGVLFVLLQFSFLNQATIGQLKNKVDVGHVVAQIMFGQTGGRTISVLIALLLIASISAMVWVGPRVTQAMAREYRNWRYFAKENTNGIPVRAIVLQATISLFMVVTSSFEQLLIYSGFILQLFTTLSVAGVLVLRWQKRGDEGAYKSPAFPWFQLIFIAFSLWIMIYLLVDKPVESLLGLVNVLVGAISYSWSSKFVLKKTDPE